MTQITLTCSCGTTLTFDSEEQEVNCEKCGIIYSIKRILNPSKK